MDVRYTYTTSSAQFYLWSDQSTYKHYYCRNIGLYNCNCNCDCDLDDYHVVFYYSVRNEVNCDCNQCLIVKVKSSIC